MLTCRPQPRRYNNSPLWSGVMTGGRAYAAYTYNVERLVPWRTLTGRQHFYLDHEMYMAYGENLPTYKPSPQTRGLRRSQADPEERRGENPQLSHSAREVAYSLHVHGKPPHADPFPGLRAGLDE